MFWFLLLKGGYMYPVPPYLSSRRQFLNPVCPLFLWWLVVVGGCMSWIGVSAVVGCYCDPCRAYLNRFSPAPLYHCVRCTLIRCAGTQDPPMQWWVAHTKVIEIPRLTYQHVFE